MPFRKKPRADLATTHFTQTHESTQRDCSHLIGAAAFTPRSDEACLVIPSVVFDAMSSTPATGFVAIPMIPLPKPLKKPLAPSSLAPLIGCVTRPVTPSKIPLPILVMPCSRPWPSCTQCHRLHKKLCDQSPHILRLFS